MIRQIGLYCTAGCGLYVLLKLMLGIHLIYLSGCAMEEFEVINILEIFLTERSVFH